MDKLRLELKRRFISKNGLLKRGIEMSDIHWSVYAIVGIIGAYYLLLILNLNLEAKSRRIQLPQKNGG